MVVCLIPDDVEWTIDEGGEDETERVVEVHRTWS